VPRIDLLGHVGLVRDVEPEAKVSLAREHGRLERRDRSPSLVAHHGERGTAVEVGRDALGLPGHEQGARQGGAASGGRQHGGEKGGVCGGAWFRQTREAE
jgi:hypothetical protein